MDTQKKELFNKEETNIFTSIYSPETTKNQIQSSKNPEGIKRKTLFSKRFKLRMNKKIQAALVKLYKQKKLSKQDQILKTRKDELEKFKINYIPLCSDEDWEAMSAFYSKKAKK